MKDMIHVVPFFHYDTVYLRSYETYLATALQHILEALRLMNEDRHYTFMVEQAILLEEFWRHFPEKRAELRRFAAEGRLEVGSGMYCMPDLNLPSGESLIRNMEIGKRWVMMTLGVEPKVFWVPDCFGHHPQMPQIAAHTGYTSYILGRVMEPDVATPFYWKGADGTKMFCERIHGNYDILVFGRAGIWDREIQSWGEEALGSQIQSRYAFLKPVHLGRNILLPNGGDMARPARLSIDAVHAFNEKASQLSPGEGGAEARFSTLAQFIESAQSEDLELQTMERDLNPPMLSGGNSSRMRIKQSNGRLSSLLQQTERLLAITEWDSKAANRISRAQWGVLRDRLDRAWKLVTFGQFHDIIWGTILDAGYLDMLRRYAEAEELLQSVNLALIAGLAQPEPTGENDLHWVGFTVFNPSSFARCEEHTMEFQVTQSDICGASLVRADGTAIRAEYREIRADNGALAAAKICFRDRIPALSTVSYRLQWEKDIGRMQIREQDRENELSYTLLQHGKGLSFENEHYRCEIQTNGCISSYVQKAGDKRELVAAGQGWNDLLLLRDAGDLYNYYYYPAEKGGPDTANVWQRNAAGHTFDTTGELIVEDETASTITLLAKGEVKWWRLGVAYEKRIILYKDEARIGFHTRLTGHGTQYRVLALFPSTLTNGRYFQEIPFGYCERPKKEFAAQQWSLLQGEDRGLLLMNRDIPGNGCEGGTLFLALTRSVTMDYKCESDLSFEEGVPYDYHYELMPYSLDADRSIKDLQPWRAAERLNMPLVGWIDGEDCVSRQVQGPQLEGDTLQLSGFYSREDGWMLRYYEAAGIRSSGRLLLNSNRPDLVCEGNGIGEEGAPLDIPKGRTLSVVNGPFQIRTLLIREVN